MKRKPDPTRPTRENPEWTDETFAHARRAREVLPELIGKRAAAKLLRSRGRPKTGNARIAISIRLPRETLTRWKETGPGWQTRMADVLTRALDRPSRSTRHA